MSSPTFEPSQRRRVVIGFLGPALDAGKADKRWMRWRPSVSLADFSDLRFDRIELLIEKQFLDLAQIVSEDISSLSSMTQVRTHELGIKDPWDFEEVYALLYDFAQTYPFNPESEDYFLHITTGSHVMQICLFLLCETKVFPARLLQSMPVDNKAHRGDYQIIDLDLSRYDAIATRFAARSQTSSEYLKQGIKTRSRLYNDVISEIELVASVTREPLLLTGPTGVGKTTLAKRIFKLKEARQLIKPGAPFIEVNCATITGEMAMSTLFGHVKGAFTGAVYDRAGLLEMANGGVLFLDEVGELGLDEQAMLLRAVEEKIFRPLGAKAEKKSDFQLLCGTNRDLADRVRRGQFREDLLARINLWEFKLPSLRERLEDMAPNLEFELAQFEKRSGRKIRFSGDARTHFLDFASDPSALWASNFREFSAAVTRMATLALESGLISNQIVDREIAKLRSRWARSVLDTDSSRPSSETLGVELEQLLGAERLSQLCQFDRTVLEHVLSVCRECRTLAEAGRRLFGADGANNPTDRIRKLLLRYELNPSSILAAKSSHPSKR